MYDVEIVLILNWTHVSVFIYILLWQECQMCVLYEVSFWINHQLIVFIRNYSI